MIYFGRWPLLTTYMKILCPVMRTRCKIRPIAQPSATSSFLAQIPKNTRVARDIRFVSRIRGIGQRFSIVQTVCDPDIPNIGWSILVSISGYLTPPSLLTTGASGSPPTRYCVSTFLPSAQLLDGGDPPFFRFPSVWLLFSFPTRYP